MVLDLLVVGLDLETGQEVCIADREVPDWHRKGHNGDQTLVCKHCYEGTDLPGGPRVVALVPKGRQGGRRRKHFAHPPGMAPPDGQHSPESLWHATAKQRLRRWAEDRGALARVEAYTPDGRRRSDVAITLPGGARLAIEVQLGEISDTQWLARHRDYTSVGITDVWLWHATTWVPRIMFAHHQPGWTFNLDADQLGLIHAQPTHATGYPRAGSPGCGEVHWPPCPEDPLGEISMALASVGLTSEGIKPSPQAVADLARRATRAPSRTEASAARQAARLVVGAARENQATASLPATRDAPDGNSQAGQTSHGHGAFRYDASPPWTEPDTWLYYCEICRRSFTGAEIKASAIMHTVPTVGTRTRPGQQLISYARYGGTPLSVTRRNDSGLDV